MNDLTEKSLKGKSGWLSPTGDLFECLPVRHWDKAMEICKKYNIKMLSGGLFVNEDPELTIEKMGWIKLSMGNVYVSQISRYITKRQLDFIFDYMLANGKNMKRFKQIFAQHGKF
jgi:hypothetical protein